MDAFTFGPFRATLNSASGRLVSLHRGEAPLSLGSMGLQVLGILLGAAPAPVPAKFILGEVWPASSDVTNVAHQIRQLRTVLGQQEGHDYILTVGKQGYCLGVAVHQQESVPSALPSLSQPPSGRGRLLYGRENVVDRIWNVWRHQQRQIIVLWGESGIGKSAIARSLFERAGIHQPGSATWLSGSEPNSLEIASRLTNSEITKFIVLDGWSRRSPRPPQTDSEYPAAFRQRTHGMESLLVITSPRPLPELFVWEGTAAEQIKVPPLASSAARLLLGEYQLSGAQSRSVEKTCAGHPAALHLWAEFLRSIPQPSGVSSFSDHELEQSSQPIWNAVASKHAGPASQESRLLQLERLLAGLFALLPTEVRAARLRTILAEFGVESAGGG